MSEQYIFVACACFRDGLTSEPPVPRSDLIVDAFGNVVPHVELNDADCDAWLDWVYDGACVHDHMRVVDEIFHPRFIDERAKNALSSGRYPLAAEAVERGTEHGIVATVDEARAPLEELDKLMATPMGKASRVVLDADDVPVSSSLDSGSTFTKFQSLNGDTFPRTGHPELLEVCVDGDEFVIRSGVSGRPELFRSRHLNQCVNEPTLTLGHQNFCSVSYTDPDTGRTASGYAYPLRRHVVQNLNGEHHCSRAPFRIKTRPMVLGDIAWELRTMRAALAACLETGYPVGAYYSGNSGGYEDPRF